MSRVVDDKSEHCIPFILERLRLHRKKYADDQHAPPFFLGLNGLQGAGKTTLVSTLSHTLRSPPRSLPTTVLSIDDLYLPYLLQQHLATSHPTNPLVQHRGQPSTHDIALGRSVFSSLRNGQPTKIPSYDKSAFTGQGDRVPEEKWECVNQENQEGQERVRVVIFEGWCVGFRPLSREEVKSKWEDAVRAKEQGGYRGRLGCNRLEDVEFINAALREYDELTDQFDALIHIDAEDTQYVYEWRLEQEAALRATKGVGMTDEQVVNFVNGYYPAYELFTERLRAGAFGEEKGRQLRLVVGKDREVKEVFRV
ncbi:uridine cytidine kinase [Lasallia pustulata]|uniref:Uridine cytidine kinase n=1 Tax=Lasallia pustulata TaxID=136370 RepID=A0A1W5DCP9_9LECA|nr:uridine cytidine kinase [Lasallia pustulata]